MTRGGGKPADQPVPDASAAQDAAPAAPPPAAGTPTQSETAEPAPADGTPDAVAEADVTPADAITADVPPTDAAPRRPAARRGKTKSKPAQEPAPESPAQDADPSDAPGPAAVADPGAVADLAAAPRSGKGKQRVAVVIPAKDESRRIAATVRSAKAIPHVDLVLVVDDGSEDDTQHVAREAGAVVVRHSHNRGKAAAMETGAAVVAMRDAPDRLPRILLFVDGDLGETAVNTAPLVPPVLEGHADLAIALLPPQVGAGGRGIVVRTARRAIASLTGWTPTQPLSGMRCITREAFEAATPLAHGWGVETGMTIDLLRHGFRVVEVPCELRHRPSGTDLKGQLHRAAQLRDVELAVSSRRLRAASDSVRRSLTPSSRSPQTHR